VHRMITMHAHPRRTDRRTNIMAIAQRYVLTNASRAKNRLKTFRVIPSSEKQIDTYWRKHKLLDGGNNNAVLNSSWTVQC